MKKLRILNVSFDTDIEPYRLSAFRGAVAQKVGLEHDWFHNHDNEHGGFHNRYPLIQYKLDTHRGQMRPMLMCIEEGVDEAHHFFSQPDWTVTVAGASHALRIAHLNVHQHALQVWQERFRYRIHKWQAFNPDNFAHYQSLSGFTDRVEYLEYRLRTQIGSFAKGVGCDLGDGVFVEMERLREPEWLSFKRNKVLVFTMDFVTNVGLPEFLGLGKGANQGLGVVRGIV